jgi:oligopeptide/dipeptide ABC transporter ATP-binding protein
VTSPLLSLNEVAVDYGLGEGAKLHALTHVSLEIGAGEIVGVVGESGCGKSTLATAILRLLPPNASVEHGSIRFGERDLLALDERALRRVRGAEIAMIFQDPLSSLNPSRTVGHHLLDVQRAHSGKAGESRSSMMRRAEEVLAEVGIPDSRERLDDYPHQFSGGMRQRIMIAMALSLKPSLIIADEPTSALDVTLAAQVLELLQRLRREHGTSILLISHDLGVIAQTCDRVVVMYAGEIVEEGAVADVFLAPRHPYTRALLDATPTRAHRGHRLETIPGSVPGLRSIPASCRFADRCRFVFSACRLRHPDLLPAGPVRVRCLLYKDGAGADTPLVASSDAPAPASVATAPASENGTPTGESLVVLDRLDVQFRSQSDRLMRLGRKRRGAVHAVDDVTLEIRAGEILGLVGESGSGKTTLARAMLGLTPPSGGQVRFADKRVDRLRRRELRRFRRQAQMIFQEPVSGLSPRLKVGYLLDEPYRIHPVPREERYSQDELLAMVGLEHEHLSK